MKLLLARATAPNECRVSLTPEIVQKLIQKGFNVAVESGAGSKAYASDQSYQDAGASIVNDDSAWSDSDIVVVIHRPTLEQLKKLQSNAMVIGLLDPLSSLDETKELVSLPLTLFSLELLPRISRAQSMDALSSQANIAGYKSVLLTAERLGKFFPMLTTAAGTIIPAKVLVIGVGVAGLQAIATAKRLGAVVEAYDIRPEVKEQVQSLGATFVEAQLDESGSGAGGYAKEISDDSKQKLQEALESHVSNADVVITTAQIPGKKAPLLVTKEMVASMKPGSVILDMASEQGGNVAGSKSGETIDMNGVTIMGPVNLPTTLPIHASQLYAKNVFALIQHLYNDKELNLNWDDEITNTTCLSHQGEIKNSFIKGLVS